MDKARLFLREEYASIDPDLPKWLSVLRSVGATECFHKHGTFYDHLLGVYRILTLWDAPDEVRRCGLFHSAYSNSYVNLAIFQPGTGRAQVRNLIGDSAEELVHFFCIVPRHELIHDKLLFRYTDDQLLQAACGEGDKLLLPEGFVTVKNIRSGENLQVPRHIIAAFLILTMADFADQLYNWQDKLFDNEDGRLEFRGNRYWSLWPGDVQPGLWMNSISRMGLLLRAILRVEAGQSGPQMPPVFRGCSQLLRPEDEVSARTLYLEAVGADTKDKGYGWVAERLQGACKANPWIGEPHLVLAQVYCVEEMFEEAEKEAAKGLEKLLEWGTAWDKRVSWEAWIAWGRVLKMNAQQSTWPETSWGMINLGLVK